MKLRKLATFAAVFGSLTVLADGNLLPSSFLKDLCDKQDTGVSHLAAGNGMPEGIRVSTDKALDPVYSIETSAPVPGAAKEGDLFVLTVAVRGVSPGGEASVLVKLQDSTYTGALRGYLTATSSDWTWCRITGVAPKDYADGTMRLHVYPWTGVQQLELRGWTLENKGQVAASTLPSLPAAPTWPAGTLEAPEASATPEAETLPDLTPAQLAKKRYVMFKFDDVKNNYGRVHDRYKRVANYLGGRGHHAGFGVIVKGLDQEPNEECVEWLKTNAVENGGNFEFWDHGWDHAMGFNCAEDDDCDPSVKYGGEFGTSLSHQRAHLTQSIDVFRQCTGLTFHTLGTAGNVGNADTLTALRDHPEMKVWIFGSVAADDVLVLERKVNLEYEVGKVSYATFVSTYKNHRQRDYMVLQGHPAMWDDANFAQFTNVVVQLEKDGWTFVTPYEYYRLVNGGETEEEQETEEETEPGTPGTESEPTSGNLLPATYLADISRKSATVYTHLAAADGAPEGVRITVAEGASAPKTFAAVPGAVKAGDLIVLTVAVRGVAADDPASVLVKFQDGSYAGPLRGDLAAQSEDWTWCRLTGVAGKDFADGSLSLYLYPSSVAQQLELRGWTLENKGQVAASSLPALPAAPTWPKADLEVPEGGSESESGKTDPVVTDETGKRKQYVIFKFDDVKNVYNPANGSSKVHDRYKRVAEYLVERGHKGSFGVIVSSLTNANNKACVDWVKANAVEYGGNFEFWLHGWDHLMDFYCDEDDGCDPTAEYGGEFGTSLQHQRTHMKLAIDTFKQWTGITFHTLGTPGNVGNADTLTALRDHPEMKVWLFGQGEPDDVMVLKRTLNLEYTVGRVDYAKFMEKYQWWKDKDYVVLQGHPAKWDDDNFAQFTNVVVQLEQDGWDFTTPYEYYQLLNGGESETGTVTGNDLYVGYPKATPTAPYATPATAAATLEEALAAAADGATIHVAPGVYEQDGVIIVSNAVTIVGDAESPTNVVFRNTVTGQWSLDRGNFIVRNTGAVLANLTMDGGYASGTNNGGISRAGNLELESGTVTNCVLMSGTCNNASGEAGGACVRGGLLVDCVIEDSGAGNRSLAIFVYQTGGRVERCTMRHGRNTFVKSLNTRLPAVNVHDGVMTDCWIEDFSLVHADGKTTYTQLNDGNSGVALVVGSSAEVSDCVFFDYRYVNHDSVPGDMYGLRENCERCVFQSAPAPFVPVVGGTERPFVVGTDSVSIMIRNAVVGQQYGYRKSATLEGLAKASVVPLSAQPTANGRLTVEIPRGGKDDSCFYQIVTY